MGNSSFRNIWKWWIFIACQPLPELKGCSFCWVEQNVNFIWLDVKQTNDFIPGKWYIYIQLTVLIHILNLYSRQSYNVFEILTNINLSACRKPICLNFILQIYTDTHTQHYEFIESEIWMSKMWNVLPE